MVNLDEAEFSPEARQMLKKDIEERKKIIDHFLITQNPKSIEKELNKYIIGQPLLKRRGGRLCLLSSNALQAQRASRASAFDLRSKRIRQNGNMANGKEALRQYHQDYYL